MQNQVMQYDKENLIRGYKCLKENLIHGVMLQSNKLT